MIVVTAPTGQIGSRLTTALLDAGEDVRVVVRDPARLSPDVRDRVEVVPGTHRDQEVVDRAFEGADALFWLVPADRQSASIYDAYVTFSVPAADAIRHHGVPRVVSVSALGRGVQTFAGNVSATLVLDDLLRSTGAHTRELANPSFMDNLLRQVASIRDEGVLRGTLPADLRLPLVATRDIADAAAALLTDRSWTGQESVPLLGPEDLSADEIAATLADVLGRPVRYERGDRRQSREQLIGFGVSPAVADALVAMDLAKENGLDAGGRPHPENTTRTTLRQWAAQVLKPAVDAGR